MTIGIPKAQVVNGSVAFLKPPQWSDLSSSAVGSRIDTGTGRLAYDYFNGGINFKNNARYPEEPLCISLQFPHGIYLGTGAVLKAHFHWYQSQVATPNFLFGYKKVKKNTSITIETDFSNYTFFIPDSNVFTYTSGTLYQITRFGEIDITDMTLSDTFDIVFFRDTANASGLFAGVDPVATDAIMKYIDCHAQWDSIGSGNEYSK